MGSYLYILALHVVSAVIWFSMIPADFILRKYFLPLNSGKGQRKLLSAWLKLMNLTGMIGLTGLLLSGIGMVLIHPVFGFFQMDGNHWLTTKQLLTVVLIVLTGAFVIPAGKKVRLALGSDLENDEPLAAEAVQAIHLLAKMAEVTGLLVAINFVFGIAHSILQLF